MNRELRILAVWLALMALLRLSLLLPHRDVEPVALVNLALQLLLFIICIDIASHSHHGQKYVYLNFTLFFGFSIMLFASSFVGPTLFRNNVYGSLYYHLYVNKVGLNFKLLLVIAFALIDYFADSLAVLVKYLVSLTIACLIIIALYHPFLFDPFQLYHEREYVTIQEMNGADKAFTQQYKRTADDHELAGMMNARNHSGDKSNVSDRSQEIERVHNLRSYLNDEGITTLFWKPLDLNSIYVNAIVLVFLCTFFTANYLFGKPHSSYLDKILILFFLFCLLEMIHLYGLITSTAESFPTIRYIAHYVTIICLLLMVYAFDLRLRFVLSVAGNYYEETLEQSPQKITRWKDEFDRRILKSFFNNIPKYSKHIGHIIKKSEE